MVQRSRMSILFNRHATYSPSSLSSATIPGHPLNQTCRGPGDIRGTTNALAIKTLVDVAKAERLTKPPPAKRRKLVTKRKKSVNLEADQNQEEAYHFIDCTPSRGKVWELEGLKFKSVEIGELSTHPSPSGTRDDRQSKGRSIRGQC